MRENKQYLSFWFWLIVPNMMVSSWIHFSANVVISFLIFHVDIYHIFFIHSSIGNLGWFNDTAIVNSATLNMGVQVSLWYPDLHSFRYMPRSGIAEHLNIAVLILISYPFNYSFNIFWQWEIPYFLQSHIIKVDTFHGVLVAHRQVGGGCFAFDADTGTLLWMIKLKSIHFPMICSYWH
jgi:hypothetical protein